MPERDINNAMGQLCGGTVAAHPTHGMVIGVSHPNSHEVSIDLRPALNVVRSGPTESEILLESRARRECRLFYLFIPFTQRAQTPFDGCTSLLGAPADTLDSRYFGVESLNRTGFEL